MITINIYYTGENGAARKFANDMTQLGIVDEIRSRKGNIRYEYFFPMDDDGTVLLIDAWESQDDLDEHHSSDVMGKIIELRDKYDLHMKVERYVSEENLDSDNKFIRK